MGALRVERGGLGGGKGGEEVKEEEGRGGKHRVRAHTRPRLIAGDEKYEKCVRAGTRARARTLTR
jgi:hypothetical protein